MEIFYKSLICIALVTFQRISMSWTLATHLVSSIKGSSNPFEASEITESN